MEIIEVIILLFFLSALLFSFFKALKVENEKWKREEKRRERLVLALEQISKDLANK